MEHVRVTQYVKAARRIIRQQRAVPDSYDSLERPIPDQLQPYIRLYRRCAKRRLDTVWSAHPEDLRIRISYAQLVVQVPRLDEARVCLARRVHRIGASRPFRQYHQRRGLKHPVIQHREVAIGRQRHDHQPPAARLQIALQPRNLHRISGVLQQPHKAVIAQRRCRVRMIARAVALAQLRRPARHNQHGAERDGGHRDQDRRDAGREGGRGRRGAHAQASPKAKSS